MSQIYVTLQKDNKTICRTKPTDLPFHLQTSMWQITKYLPVEQYRKSDFPQFQLVPEPENSYQHKEWPLFMRFLHANKRVALVSLEGYELYIQAPDAKFSHAVVMYRILTPPYIPNPPIHIPGLVHNLTVPTPPTYDRNVTGLLEVIGDNAEYIKGEVNTSAPLSVGEATNVPKVPFVEKNFSSTHPTYLKTLSQTHAGWIFGALAELVDNSRDARSKRLDINIESLYSKKEGRKIPVLSVVDDGQGMSHDEMMTMIAFGHSLPKGQQPDHIGRFGIGFKTGSMRLGKDAIVLTQTSNSRSVALLSQSFNEGKPNLEIPVVSYHKHDNYMEFDLNIQSEASGEYTLKAIKDFSPFNEYFLGEKLGLFGEAGTGTQIYIWNLDKWGQNYTLDWDNKEHKGDILIRSKRIRTRRGHLSQEVPLDYSLRAYMEVIFLNPRMKIYIQHSLVKARPLAKSLNKTAIVNDIIMGKPLQLTLGRSKTEWERFNSGIFLYWHGRLIEAYKRVGSQIFNMEVGRGILGVVDVINLMDDDDGNPWVMNSKQGFQDCETYAKLEECLGKMFDQYWDRNFDTLDLKKGSDRYNPDHQWVQCDKCRKWRVLESDFDTKTLPLDWFCFMPPYSGKCEDPEKQVGRDVITVSSKRTGYGIENITKEDHGSPPVGPGKKKGSDRYNPDHQWVQCVKCRKWRVLESDFDAKTLPLDWFCFMPPYSGKCEDPEKQVGRDVITVSSKRTGYGIENITKEDHGSPSVGPGKRGRVPLSKHHSPASGSSPTTETTHTGTNIISTDDEDFEGTSENIEETNRTKGFTRLRQGQPKGGKY